MVGHGVTHQGAPQLVPAAGSCTAQKPARQAGHAPGHTSRFSAVAPAPTWCASTSMSTTRATSGCARLEGEAGRGCNVGAACGWAQGRKGLTGTKGGRQHAGQGLAPG